MYNVDKIINERTQIKDMKTEDTPQNPLSSLIKSTTSITTFRNRWDHFLSRWGINRLGHRIEPGLYALGNPRRNSHVFVTANYTLSFDALRSALAGMNCYILVLDTKGINVWCAAGGGYFSTEELLNRIEVTRLREIVTSRVLILPQLSAPGIASYEVKKRSGFKVEYGPVRAADIPEYLKIGSASSNMRRVSFPLYDRIMLVGVEIMHTLLPMLLLGIILFFLSGLLASAATVASILAGVVLFPILLPWIPTSNFSTKGFILGGIIALPFVILILLDSPNIELWKRMGTAISFFLIFPSITAFLALNFTGSTPFTSKSGVRREIFAYFPKMAWMFCVGIVCSIALMLLRVFGGP
jgi:hypothetical protein